MIISRTWNTCNRSCEAAHALCIGHTIYTATISDYGHPERIFGPTPKSFDTAAILSGVVAACGMLSLRCFCSYT
jgi:hypothetical protein